MSPVKLTPEQLFKGLFAAVRLRSDSINGEQTDIHRAFYRVLRDVRASHTLEVDLFDVDYDPLYGQSGWFDRALTTAQRDSVLSFANPSYNKILIKYDQDEGREILTSLGAVDEFERLANIFTESLGAVSVRGSSL